MRPGSRAEGRERELDRLSDVFEGVAESGVRLALVEGPPGVGKGQVVSAFADRVRAGGGAVLAGSCLAGRPYAPFETIVEQAISEVRRTGARGAGVESLRCPDGCHALWFQHRGGAAHTEDQADVPVARRCLHGAVAVLLHAIAEVRPAVLALHDLEQADAESLELLVSLLESVPRLGARAARLLIVATLRDGARLPERVTKHPRVVRLRIDALDRDGLRALLSSPEHLSRLLDATGGLPAAVERLLSSEPPTPEEHLSRRLATLGDDARRLFDALALLERPATESELSFVADVADASGLAELLAARLVHADGQVALADPDDAARARARMDHAARRAMERRCVALCLREPRDAADAVRYAVRAGLAHEALRHWEEACDALEARHAHAVAADLLGALAGLLGDATPTAVYARIAELRLATGEFQLALRAARRVLAAHPAEPEAARRVAQALVLAGELPEATRIVSRARAAADGDAAAELGATLAELLYQHGRLDDAEQVCGEVLGDAGAKAAALLSAMQTRAKVALARGALGAAERAYADYEARARSLGDVRHEALAVGGRGVVMLTRGSVADAERALDRCAALAAAANDKKGQALAWHNLAVAAHLAHDYATARARYEEALTLLRLVGNRTSLARCAYNLGELYESLGDRARARTMADFGAQVGGTGLAPRAEAEGLLLRGRVTLGDGQAAQARTAFEAAWEILARVDTVRAAAAACGLAQVALHEGRVDDAADWLERAGSSAPAARRAEIALTRVSLARARGGDCLPAAREAVRAAKDGGDDLRRVEALVELATVLRDRGEHARSAAVAGEAAELDARVGERVPEDLAAAWDDRPMRRRLLVLKSGGPPRERPSSPGFPAVSGARIAGGSRAVRHVLSIVERVGPSRCTVLLTGESGTGKELVAEALHDCSPRRGGPLVRVNCAALVESLLVSELFGHEKGAFTGAHELKKGRFELAHGGTLFLDEIGDISPAVQAALLRVLQERRFERVGGRRSIDVDVRIVAATNRDLEAMVHQGTFREDLYYRLNEVRIEMPPLRGRVEDIPALVQHLLARVARERGEEPKRVSQQALELLAQQPWPGNVRQLENALRVASLFADGAVVEPVHLVGSLGRASAPGDDSPPARPLAPTDDPYHRVRSGELSLRDLKKEIERRCIEQALVECDGNISKAAGVLGMKRPRLSQLVKEYGLRSKEDGQG